MKWYQKGIHYSPKTEFKPGMIPANKKTVGFLTIRIDKNGKKENMDKSF